MKKIIKLNNQIFEYDEENLAYNNTFPITEEDAREVLDKTQSLLKAKGIEVYLNFGTLLGAVREKGLIKGDEDVDVFSDRESDILECLPYLEENGLHLVRYNKGALFSFRINERAYIDIYVLRPMECISIWTPFCYILHKNVTPKKFFKEYQDIDFLGLKCRCVKDPEKMIEFWYGKNWRTPVKGKKFYYEVKSHYYWRNLVRRFMFEAIGWPWWRHLIMKKFSNQKESMESWKKLYHNKL